VNESYAEYLERLYEMRQMDPYDDLELDYARRAEAARIEQHQRYKRFYENDMVTKSLQAPPMYTPPAYPPMSAPPTAPAVAPPIGDLQKQIQSITIERSGNKLILPATMSPDAAIAAIQAMKALDSKPIDVEYDFQKTVPDGALALFNTLNDLYGFVKLMDTPGFFGPTPPQLLTVEVSPGVTQRIPWGRFSVPGLEGHLQTSIKWVSGLPYFHLTASIPAGARGEVQHIVDHMNARKESIYRGHAIKVRFPPKDDDPPAHDFFPKFMNVTRIPEQNLIFSRDLHDIIDMALFTPIKKTEFCREHNISRKRTILLEGPPGVGKTLTATIVATMGPDHGWTFIHVEDINDLGRAYRFAIDNQPAILSCEDLDLVLKRSTGREGLINDILNEIDGLESKEQEILLVLTTNFVEKITQEALRPGRIDAVVPVRPPDADAVQRLVRLYAGEAMPPTEDLTKAGELLAGKNAAVVREVVERSKLSAVRRLDGPGQELCIRARDIEVATQGMEAHNKLLEPVAADHRSDIEKAASIVAGALACYLVDYGRATPQFANGAGGTPPPRDYSLPPPGE
jgi:transitional endoplasmic reticulum ATPase